MSHGGKNSDEKSFDRSAKISPTSPSFVWMCVCVCVCMCACEWVLVCTHQCKDGGFLCRVSSGQRLNGLVDLTPAPESTRVATNKT